MQTRIEHRLFDTLFAAEYSGVLALVRRICGQSSAEDVAQEAFAALLRGGPEDPGHARHWLYRVAFHRALDAVKRNRSRRARELQVVETASPPGPPDLIERREAREAVRAALRTLKPDYAAALSLRHSGFSYKEIADVLNVPVDRVGVMLIRAEAALKKELTHVHSPQ